MAKPQKNKATESADDNQLTVSVSDEVTKVVTPSDAPVEGIPAIDELPEPSQEVLDAPPQTTAQGDISPTGEAWDESIHENPPRLSARGSWAKKRGGARKHNSAPRAYSPTRETNDAPEISQKEIDAKIKLTATMAASTLFLAGEMVIGDCMKPEPDEREIITNAFTDYFHATGVIEVPPWVGLLGACSIYVAKRWSHPQFSEKVKNWLK